MKNDGVRHFSRMKAYQVYVDCEKMSYNAFVAISFVFLPFLRGI